VFPILWRTEDNVYLNVRNCQLIHCLVGGFVSSLLWSVGLVFSYQHFGSVASLSAFIKNISAPPPTLFHWNIFLIFYTDTHITMHEHLVLSYFSLSAGVHMEAWKMCIRILNTIILIYPSLIWFPIFLKRISIIQYTYYSISDVDIRVRHRTNVKNYF
jgi:hypothetical protein